jgi:hypothetical protein
MSIDVPAADRRTKSEVTDRFAAELRILWAAAGQRPCREISRDLYHTGNFYSKSTISEVLRGARLPKPDLLRDLIGYFGGDVPAWEARLAAIRTAQVSREAKRPLPTVADAVVPRQLPIQCNSFTGRQAQLAQLDTIFDYGPTSGLGPGPLLATVIGPGGVGKTSLAVHWAHRHTAWFPDGQLFVDLQGFGPEPVVPAATAIKRFLIALGVPAASHPSDTDSQVALYRSLVADRRMLIVLDNAANSEHVLPLLPGGSRCAVLVTSRMALGALAVRGASPVPLGVLTDPEAREFLASRLGEQRVTGLPDTVATLLRCCGGLPLALSVVAARAVTQPDRSLPELAAELNEDRTRLDALDVGEVEGDLRRVLSWSYEALTTDTARAFRLLGLAPGTDVRVEAAAALLGLGHAPTTILLRQLITAHLLQETAGRYRMHDLVRLFAMELSSRVDLPSVRSDSMIRVCEWYLRNADRADRILAPHRTHVFRLRFADHRVRARDVLV